MGNNDIGFERVSNLDHLEDWGLQEAVSIYQRAFADPPYNEAFTPEEAQGALQYILDKNGDLIIGAADGKVVSLAGGYFTAPREYFIEELAVDPELQGNGLGRKTLRALIDRALEQGTDELEICTSAENVRAIGLYESEGFVKQPILKAGPHFRVDGSLLIDYRVYLERTIDGEKTMEKPTNLKRAVIAYPSGNTTAIVTDQMLDEDRQSLNDRIMRTWQEQFADQPEIEQCCFVTAPKSPEAVARVEMFGGEFCGNATRSVIRLITEGKDYAGKIEVSGVDRPLAFESKDGNITVEMPLPQEPASELAKVVDEGVLVSLDGIAHVVVTDDVLRKAASPKERLQSLLASNTYGLAEQPAVGVTYYNEQTEVADFAVWVKEVDTIFDETACGSGTSSIGIALAQEQQKSTTVSVLQPSGETINTAAHYDAKKGKVVSSTISGTVDILYDGRLTLV